jgi:hypothetical protein
MADMVKAAIQLPCCIVATIRIRPQHPENASEVLPQNTNADPLRRS